MEKVATMGELKQGYYSLDDWIDLHEAILVRYLESKKEMDGLNSVD